MTRSRHSAKALIAVLLLILLALCVFVAALAISDALREEFARFLTQASFGVRVGALCVCAAVAAMMAACCFLPFVNRRAPDLTLKTHASGSVTITAAALEKMAELAVKNISGVRDVRVVVSTRDDRIAYRIAASITTGANVPQIVDKMHERVMQYVQERVGIPVTTVDVSVSGCVQEDSSTALVTPRVK